MDNSKSPLTLIGVGIIIGAVAVLVLGSLGFKLEEVGVGPFKFTASTATPTTTPQATPNTALLPTTVTPASLPIIPPTSAAATTPLPTALSQLGQELLSIIETESDATKNKDMNRLLPLYAQDAIVLDFQSRQVWSGTEQLISRYNNYFACCFVLESQYTVLDIKPNPDSQDKVTVKVRQRGKVLDAKTKQVMETRPTQQLWYFGKVDSRWKILAFIYNIPD
jgi:ketosteroid isomerase-like protein